MTPSNVPLIGRAHRDKLSMAVATRQPLLTTYGSIRGMAH